jgi:ribosome-associated toxin RatA of RatAB toxin-antitoxin module
MPSEKGTTMITLKRARLVEATPQEIFDTLADPQELTRLIPRVQRVDVLERHADHARIVTHMALGGAFGTIRCEGELRWVEPQSLSFTVRKPLPIENRWSFTPVAGGTEVEVQMSLDLTPMLGPFAQFVPTVAVSDMLSKDLDSTLDRIAARMASVNLKERAVAA